MQSADAVALATTNSAAPGAAEDAARVLEQIRSGEIATVIVGGCDWNGVFRAKRVPAVRFAAAEEPGAEFSDYLWAIDIEDEAQPTPPDFEGWWPDWSTGFGDVEAIADLGTLRRVPWLRRTAVALCNYRYSDGRDYDVAPRNVLCQVLDRYARHGLEARMAPELEFIVFDESEKSATEKGFRNLQPIATRPEAYGAMQGTIDDGVIGTIVEQLTAMRVPVDTWAPESAPGQYELNLHHAPALEAADIGFLFKHGVKELCALNGRVATFMPKLAAGGFGSSLHVHQSLWRDGESAFFDPDGRDGMSALLRHFVAGQLETLIPFAPIWLPTPPAYKRRSEDHAAVGTTKTWGGDNKTISLRVLAGSGGACRVEHRVPGADANVYLVMAAMLAGGLYGIENELELAPATSGDAYGVAGLEQLPTSLDAAIGAFEESPVANRYLGEEFVRRFAATRRWEVEQSQREVTDWELKRYFTRI